MSKELFEQVLKNNSVSITKERVTLFEILQRIEEPATMQQLVALAKPELNRSTVYRTVDLFEKCAIVIKLYTGWKYRIELSEIFKPHHHHFTCLTCGSVLTIEEPELLQNWQQALQKKLNIEIKHHQLELNGQCSTCRLDY